MFATGRDGGEYEAALGLAWLSESGCHSVLRLLGREGPESIWRASRRRLLAWGMTTRMASGFEEKRRRFVSAEAEEVLSRSGLGFLPFGSPCYPAELTHLRCPPAGLFFRGEREMLERLAVSPRVTIVGTRKATAYGLQVAEAFAAAFADKGIAVVSGMALGIDAQAHRATIRHGGFTVATLGCGADVVYPRRHRELYGRIAVQGIVLSELPPGTPPSRWTFPNRNRLLAALGDAVVVVEASQTSGALQTADWALELGRPVFSVPGPISGPGHEGCNRLLYDGACLALNPCVTVEDFLLQTRMGWGGRRTAECLAQAPDKNRPREDCSQAREVRDQGILEALESGPSSADALMASTGLAARELTVALAELEIAGLVARAGPGTYIRAP